MHNEPVAATMATNVATTFIERSSGVWNFQANVVSPGFDWQEPGLLDKKG
jgi:hypothetical protein